MAGKLAGKIAVVTGGSAGIGLAAARRFAEEGAHVFITGRRQRELDEAAKQIGPAATAIRADAANTADIEASIASALILAAVLILFSVVIFVWLLGLPIPLWPGA